MRYKTVVSPNQNLWKGILYFLLLGVAIIITSLDAQAQPYKFLPPVDIVEGWEYRWGDSPLDSDGVPVWVNEEIASPEWMQTGSPQNPPGRNGVNNLWVRIRLPAGEWQDPSLYINSVNLNFEAYLENEIIYEFGEIDASGKGAFSGWPFHIIPLPPGFGGKTLYFRIYSEHINIGVIGTVSIGSQANHIARIVRKEIDSFILGSLLVLISFFPISILFIRNRNKTYSFGSLSLFSAPFGLFSLSSGIYMIAQGQIKGLFFYAPLLWSYLELISLYLIPVGIALFFEGVIGAGYKSIVRRIWQGHLAYTIVALVLVGLKVVPLPLTLVPVLYVLILDILILVSTAVVAAVKGNLEARIFTLGFIILASFAIYDVLIGLGLINWSHPLSVWGIFFFVLSLGFILGFRIVELYRDVEIMAENARDIIYRYRFTPTRGFEYISPAAVAIIGYTSEELYSDPDLILKIGHPEDQPQLGRYFRGEDEFGKPIAMRWLHKEGDIVWTEHQNVPVYGKGGNLIAVEGIARDITERKMLEEAQSRYDFIVN